MLTQLFRKNISIYFTITLIVFLSTFVLWLPFLLRLPNWLGLPIKDSNFLYIYKHYDGPLYIIAAKSFYNPEVINNLKLEMTQGPIYFAAHLPLYPILIRVVREIGVVGGYLRSMIFVNIFFTIFLASFFYFLVNKFKLVKNPLILTIVFLFLPRFLVVRSIGAPESLFILLILLSLYFFEKENYLLAGLFGGLSVVTKSPGILLFPAYGLVILERLGWLRYIKINWQWLYLLLIPLGLLGVFGLYGAQYHDFLAYFHSGDNIHLAAPFSVFNFSKSWVGTAWLEDILFYFFVYLFTVFSLKDSKYRSFFYFSLVFFVALTFVQHRDITRYSLPLWPLACIAFSNFLTSKRIVLGLLILLPAIYIYAWNFLSYNVMPINNWRPFF